MVIAGGGTPGAGFNKHANAKAATQQKHVDLMAKQHATDMANVHFLTYGGAQGFGGNASQARTVFAPGKRRRLNLVAVCLNIFLPFAMFASLYCLMSFKVHYRRPGLVWLISLIYLVIAFVVSFSAHRLRTRDREPRWLVFAAGALFVAVVAAVFFGNMNYRYNLLPYYEIDSLNTYPSVNPATDYGQMMMDGGKIYFGDGTGLDMKKATSFKNTDLYCVVPIVVGDEKLSHYDFWAVGTNCCSGVSPDFRCGQFNNPKARSGIRLVWDAERPFYRLAVQMAEAQFNINAPHPLFFQWIQDPVAELDHYLDSGWRYYLLGISCHFAINLFASVSAMVMFSKIGHF